MSLQPSLETEAAEEGWSLAARAPQLGPFRGRVTIRGSVSELARPRAPSAGSSPRRACRRCYLSPPCAAHPCAEISPWRRAAVCLVRRAPLRPHCAVPAAVGAIAPRAPRWFSHASRPHRAPRQVREVRPDPAGATRARGGMAFARRGRTRLRWRRWGA